MFTNEEEIRGKLILPFISDLGFDLSEISLEYSFSIRLGKTQHNINGRSDILCKRNGKNLFVIELKSDYIQITQKDIDQGISYSRALLDNIAPFTIITNGKVTRIFDSITRNEITGKKLSECSSYWKDGYTISLDEELLIRYEALKNFISFSSENLKIFCTNQVKERMGPIIGEIDSPMAKFTQSLYMERIGLTSTFRTFMQSNFNFFGIVGEAGVGKTNALCSLAIESLKDNFVFFYNAAIIHRSPLEHIAQDLNGVFQNNNNSDIVLRKLDEIARSLNKNVIIFIDAIDESINPNISLELSEIALSCRNFNKIKFCISCKLNLWDTLINYNNHRTHLFEELSKFHPLIEKANNSPGYLIENFNDDEINEIIPLYKNIFGFNGEISASLLNDLRNGFFLRIFSQVYMNQEIPSEINYSNLIKIYLEQSLVKTNLNILTAKRILSKIGKALLSNNYTDLETFYDRGIEVENLTDKLDLTTDSSIPESLFSRNILIKSHHGDSYHVNFYYSKIRDYVICFYSFKLNQLSDNEFYLALDDLYSNYIGESAITFYKDYASSHQKNLLIKYKNAKATEYVKYYNDFLNKNLKNLKNLFDPYTNGDIGILLPKDVLGEDGYALFPLKQDTEILQYETFGGFLSPNNHQIFSSPLGVKMVHMSNLNLLRPNPEKRIKNYVFDIIKNVIYKGEIYENDFDILLREKIATILYFYHEKLEYVFNLSDFNLPRYEYIYPIDLEDLRYRLYKFRARQFYGATIDDHSVLNKKIEQAYLIDETIPPLKDSGSSPPFEELFRCVNVLLGRGYKILENHHLPYPDIDIKLINEHYKRTSNYSQIRSIQYSKKQARLYTESFLICLENSYKDFVEYYFPTYKDNFRFYNGIPYEYFVYTEDNNNFLNPLMLGYRPLDNSNKRVHFRDYTEISIHELLEKDKLTSIGPISLNNILYDNEYIHEIRSIKNFKTPKLDDYSVIRSWVYKFLRSDISEIIRQLDKEK